MKEGSNVVEMGAAIQQRVDELRATRLPPDVAFAIGATFV